ncbi:hypothetical protein BDV26DRAFT_301630 [Aspergillus bertholletiae]|uniref:Enoyl reductase (ER) domain-containing protein n=1 Tax=Aspergillus bertholletiae TaxID=1226010 RepID=A0A5N7AUS6_9EURO|nr:hypothetical protein BDV26DRAFT_301630 [Aspergillus bertholletiae]
MSGYTFTTFRGSPSAEIHEVVTERPSLLKDEVLIKVTHSGVCGTDEHFRRSGIALGHEGVGVVTELGPEVKSLKITNPQTYGVASQDSGSFATAAIRSERYLQKIPDGLASDDAAPLMCAGITVWSALSLHGVRPSDTVGVVGIGGLGHLAIQFAKAMGCEVIAFSATSSKEEQSLKLGASCFLSTENRDALPVPKRLDHLLITSSQNPDWDLFIPILANGAKIFPLAVVEENERLDIPYMPCLMKSIQIIFSIPNIRSFRSMLDFAAKHKIGPIIDRDDMTADGIVRSMEKLKAGNTRYRGVLYCDSHN